MCGLIVLRYYCFSVGNKTVSARRSFMYIVMVFIIYFPILILHRNTLETFVMKKLRTSRVKVGKIYLIKIYSTYSFEFTVRITLIAWASPSQLPYVCACVDFLRRFLKND